MSTVLASQTIASGSVPIAETVISTIAISASPAKNRIRGHINITGNAAASTVTLRVREASLTGTQLYTTGALTVAAAASGQIVFEVEDDNNFVQLPPPQNPVWVVTVVASLAGTLNSGYVTLEQIP